MDDGHPNSNVSVEAVPVLHSIMQRVQELDREDLPSTVDMDALKQEPVLSAALETPLLAWRSTAGPRMKVRAAEVTIKKEQVSNGIDGTSRSEESRVTDATSSESEESDSDSESESESSSSNSGTTSGSATASSTSDSESDTHSNRSSSSHSVTQAQPCLSIKPQKRLHKTKKSRSSSTSSRSRHRDKHTFAVTPLNYEPGSLKLKIAALKIPRREDQVRSLGIPITGNTTNNTNAIPSSQSSVQSNDKRKSTRVVVNSVENCDVKASSASGDSDSTNTKMPKNPSRKQPEERKLLETTTPRNNQLRRSARTRTKSVSEIPISNPDLNSPKVSRKDSINSKPAQQSRVSPAVAQTQNGPRKPESDQMIVPGKSTGKTTPKHVNSVNKNINLHSSNLSVPVGPGNILRAKKNDMSPTVPNGLVTNLPKNSRKVHTSPAALGSLSLSSSAVADSVLMLAKNADLTIFPVSSLVPPARRPVTPKSITNNMSNKHDLIITASAPPSISSTEVLPSPLRSSRRISAQRRSMDAKYDDNESWDSEEASGAVQTAIQTMDRTVESENSTAGAHNRSKKPSQSLPTTPISTKKSNPYKSPLLEKFAEALQTPKGQLPPKVGDVSIEPIIPLPRHASLQQLDTVCENGPKFTKICAGDFTNDINNISNTLDRSKRSDSNKLQSSGTTIAVIKNEDGNSKIISPEIKLSKSSLKKFNGSLELEGQQVSPMDTKKKPKPNKLSIFAPQLHSQRAKLLRSNGSITPNESLLASSPESAAELKSEGSNTPVVPSLPTMRPLESKSNKKTRAMQAEKEELNLKKSLDKSTKQQKLNKSDIRVDSPSADSATSITANGILPATPSSTTPSPVRTKAAKKYIPETDSRLVIPQVSHGVSKQGRKRKLKKSSKSSKKNRKHNAKNLKAMEELCDLVRLEFSLTTFDQKSGAKSPGGRKRTENDKILDITNERLPPTFTFKKIKYHVKPTPLIPFDEIPPPSQDVLLNHRAKSSSKTDVIRTTWTPTKKRKAGSKDRDIQDSGSDVSISSESCGSDLQRLPLKKRHHHNNASTPANNLKPSTHRRRSLVHKFGTKDNLKPLIIAKAVNQECSRFTKLGKEGTKISLFQQLLVKIEGDREESSVASSEVMQQEPSQKRRSGRARKSVTPVVESILGGASNGDSFGSSSGHSSEIRDTATLSVLPTGSKVKKESVSSVLVVKEVISAPAAIMQQNNRKRAGGSSLESQQSPRKVPKSEIKIEPLEVLEIIDVVKEEQDGDSSPLSANETLTVSLPSTPTYTAVATPPEHSATPHKKRRKVNKTGFPTAKKKKKVPGSAKLIDGILTPQSSGVEESGNESAVTIDEANDTTIGLETLTGDPLLLLEAGCSTPTEIITEDDGLDSKEMFSASLSERVKIRKRKSIDDGYSNLVEKGVILIPGLCPSLVNVEDAPLILPEKNNYLTMGMLSNMLKRMSSDQVVPPSKPSIESPTKALKGKAPRQRDVVGFSRVLPPPSYCEGFLRSAQKEFILPYDVWCHGVINTRNLFERWKEEKAVEMAEAAAAARRLQRRRKAEVAHKTKKMVMPEIIPPSWKFKKIRSNVYFGTKPPYDMDSEQMCSCLEGGLSKCTGDDCLNRLVFTECPPGCGDSCGNRRIQKHLNVNSSVKRFMTSNKGFGVKAIEEIKKGEFILEYVGEVVPDALFKERMHTIYAEDTHHYCLQLDGGMVIDGHRVGGECRFVNHSCEPNCEMQKWCVNGLSRMALFALRDIHPEEELSYDYNFSLYNPSEGQPCYCGSEHCRGVIGGRSKGKVDVNGSSKRKVVNTKLLGAVDMHTGAQDPAILDKMKPVSRRDRVYIQSHNIFLIRNYEKIRFKRSTDSEDKIGDKLEKLMTPWISRFKAGSSKNKPLILNDDDPRLAELAKLAQIFHELLVSVTSIKEGSHPLCEAFMKLPPRRKFPLIYSQWASGEHPLDLTIISKKIIRGEYSTISSLEADIGAVLHNFAHAFEKDKPGIADTVQKIKDAYTKAKTKAVSQLEPFIVNGIQPFKESDSAVEDVIRCICGTYSEEGFMIQCEKCLVWQHGDCVGISSNDKMETYPTASGDKRKSLKGKRGNSKKRSESISPMKATTSALLSGNVNGMSPTTVPRKISADVKQEVELGDDLISIKEELLVVDVKEESERLASTTTSRNKDKLGPDDSFNINDMDTQRIDFDEPMDVVPGSSDGEVTEKPAYVGNTFEFVNSSKLIGASTTSQLDNISNVKKRLDVSSPSEPYYCEKCSPRINSLDIPNNFLADQDKKHYLTFVREDGFIIRKNDTVYVLRAKEEPVDCEDATAAGSKEKQKAKRTEETYKTAGPLVPSNCDIFRVEDLFIDNDCKKIFGHNYLRPFETFHEPSRKFYPNEILKSPLTEVVNFNSIHGQCWVMDPQTFCKGRPIGAKEEHIYICEFRVDKKARSFAKIGNKSQIFCTKPFAFKHFENKLIIQRNVYPHGPPSPDFKLKSSVTSGVALSERTKPRKTDDKAKPKHVVSLKESNRFKKLRTKLNRIIDSLHEKVPYFKDGFDYEPAILLQDRKKSKIFA
ncbi:unnamed protein product [Allacma fusca]|uniref:Histone-lysine N-methyltransferase ASH1L n=2 Tax=Allacma fusca TaxID=39272 RepID=A0A8J2JED9_9HEXA|nr:unnamed protein product [Allacma fusca]